MRLFVAINVSPKAAEELKRVQQKIKGNVKLTNDYHITLKFLGEVPEEKLRDIKKKLALVKFKPFEINLDGIGTFPKIIWCKISPQEPIKMLADLVQNYLDFPKDDRPFKPHINLARIKKVDNLPQIRQEKIEPVSSIINSFALKKSTLTRNGAMYEDLEIYKSKI